MTMATLRRPTHHRVDVATPAHVGPLLQLYDAQEAEQGRRVTSAELQRLGETLFAAIGTEDESIHVATVGKRVVGAVWLAAGPTLHARLFYVRPESRRFFRIAADLRAAAQAEATERGLALSIDVPYTQTALRQAVRKGFVPETVHLILRGRTR